MYVALIKDKSVLEHIHLMAEANFSEILLPSIASILEKNKINVNDIEKIYATIGPGSFTGIRIGLTVCKVLAWTLGKGVIPISSLEFMATTQTDTDYKIPVIDARHDKVFGSVYDKDMNVVIADDYTSLDDLTRSLTGSYTYIAYDDFGPDNTIGVITMKGKFYQASFDILPYQRG